jgi:hypothetical protein
MHLTFFENAVNNLTINFTDIDYISGDLGGAVSGVSIGRPQKPIPPPSSSTPSSSLFDHHFGSFFPDTLFGFPSFGFNGFNGFDYKPWYKG